MIAPTPPSALSLPLRTPRSSARAPIAPPEIDVALRFTADGSRELEQQLARTCTKIAAGVRGLIPARKIECVLLGGGYGRGEGGVLRTPAGDRPYNDLEFYVCLRGNRHGNELRYGRALHVLGEILTPQAGLDVEFKITSLAELARAPVSMFSYDLMHGHRVVIGQEAQLARCAHHRAAEEIPLSEATRLLMNRCTGLLLARERLERPELTPADTDFVRRNIAKAQLALGDALLVAYLQYHWSVRERHRLVERLARIEPMPWLADVRAHHAIGVEFKLHPERSTAARDALLAEYRTVTELARTVFFWLETQRLETDFARPAGYARSLVNKWPEAAAPRNVLINVKALGLRALLEGRAGRHPRERVLHALALLLWEPTTFSDPVLRAILQRELRTSADSFAAAMPVYRALWSQVN